MRTVFILGGGGAKGSREVGGVVRLAEAGIKPDIIYGTSVGALIGAMVAQDELQTCVDIFSRIKTEDILDKTDGPIEDFVARVIPHGDMWYDLIDDDDVAFWSTRPAQKLIAENIDIDKVKIPFRCGVTAIREGTYHTLRSEWYQQQGPGKPAQKREFQQAILASSSQACIMPLVSSIVLGQADPPINIRHVADGGHRRVVPVKDYIEEGIQEGDTVWVLACQNPFVYGQPVTTGHIVSRFLRVFDIFMQDNNQDDWQYALHVLKEKGIAVHISVPYADMGDGLEFSPALHEYRFHDGYMDVDEILTRGDRPYVLPGGLQ